MHHHFRFLPIFSDFVFSKEFLIKKVGPIPQVSLQNLSVNILRYTPMLTFVIQNWKIPDEYIFILASWLFIAILRFLRNFLLKNRAYSMVISSENDIRYPNPYAQHFYTNVASFWWKHVYLDFLPILSDFAISKEFFIKKVGSIPQVSLQNLSVNILRYLLCTPLLYKSDKLQINTSLFWLSTCF